MAASPFPGMDPYLESPDLWSDVHTRLMSIFAENLSPRLVPKYIAELETQLVIDQIYPLDEMPNGGKSLLVPDVTVTRSAPSVETGGVMVADTIAVAPLRLRYADPVQRRQVTLRIVRREGEKVVAVVELLSPFNKRRGKGRNDYFDKRIAYFRSPVHLIEIDLLRNGEHMPIEDSMPACDYVVMVSDARQRPEVGVWPLSVRDSLPIIPIPLSYPDAPVMLDIGQALRTAYERARYDLRIHYDKPANPPLNKADTEWAKALIATQSS